MGSGKCTNIFRLLNSVIMIIQGPLIQDIPNIFPIPNFKKPSIDPFYGLFLCCF